jgi:uncharacterized glyoxalase superfamily protein PhnB
MLWNRSIPRASVIPVLAYPDAPAAAAWLCAAFGFTVRLRVDTHRVQLNVGEGAVIVRELRPCEMNAPLGLGHNLTVRVADADAHCTHAQAHGAQILDPPTTHAYGERQYVAQDPAGHQWTFSQSITDLHPEAWGGAAEQL